jgi:hypothetical protein
MTFEISASVLFVGLVWATIRYSGHHPFHATLAFLAGFFIASTGAAPYISQLVQGIAHALGKL